MPSLSKHGSQAACPANDAPRGTCFDRLGTNGRSGARHADDAGRCAPTRRALRAAATLALAAPLLLAAAPPHTPRVVSINPCLDAILMQVADPAQIVAISHYSQDPRATSIPLAQAKRFAVTAGTAEEVVALRPDIVVAGGHVAPATVAALARLRVHLVQYPVPVTVEESAQQVREVAAAIGHADRGRALADRILAAARPAAGAPVPALIWGASGLVPGGGTLPDDLLRRAGFANASVAYGLKRWDVLPLEYLVARPPRVLLSVAAAEGGGERGERHPALRRLAGRVAVAPFAARLMNCGGPSIIAAMARLRSVRARVAR
ncbi:iron complex transport system substrate-binding protein [Sphingomonas sp. BE138]|uniref:ABC transporter substrate-binding protein n=1 Tax=Sphingomonas sp. BE138 TaxID=2817845 RepID=UPI002855C213|nr:ABC transporter substrate-binding protein [Sphingomonas sp. BE138]MDR6789626.1 iron complex transport system substrate-binding protein [Sphingomonas sp. BE138]